MNVGSEQFVVDGAGNRSAVLLNIARYFELIEAEEELESIRSFDAAKAGGDEAIPLDQAIEELRSDQE
jgi:hypothetical protein